MPGWIGRKKDWLRSVRDNSILFPERGRGACTAQSTRHEQDTGGEQDVAAARSLLPLRTVQLAVPGAGATIAAR